MKTQREILMAGTGGQGLVLMATLLAEAAMVDGKNVAQSQSYGVAQRGGFISAEVVMSEGEVVFQQVRTPNIILALHGVVGARYDEATVPVLYDSTLFTKDLPRWCAVPFTQIARELGVVKAANIVALGAMTGLCDAVSIEALETVVRRKFRAEVAEANIKALHLGKEAAQPYAGA